MLEMKFCSNIAALDICKIGFDLCLSSDCSRGEVGQGKVEIGVIPLSNKCVILLIYLYLYMQYIFTIFLASLPFSGELIISDTIFGDCSLLSFTFDIYLGTSFKSYQCIDMI